MPDPAYAEIQAEIAALLDDVKERPRLGGEAIAAVLRLALGEGDEVTERASAVLRGLTGRTGSAPRQTDFPFRRPPTRESYLLVDRLLEFDTDERTKVALLLDWLEESAPGPNATLRAESSFVLPKYVELRSSPSELMRVMNASPTVLRKKFWRASSVTGKSSDLVCPTTIMSPSPLTVTEYALSRRDPPR